MWEPSCFVLDLIAGTEFVRKKTIAADATNDFVNNILVLQENDVLKMLSDITGPDVTVRLLETNREDL